MRAKQFTEEYLYDGFGNITNKKTISGLDGNSKFQKDAYDPTGRFVDTKLITLDETKFTYNSLGQILTQTDTDGNTVTNIYDVWGKLQSSASSLAGTTTSCTTGITYTIRSLQLMSLMAMLKSFY